MLHIGFTLLIVTPDAPTWIGTNLQRPRPHAVLFGQIQNSSPLKISGQGTSLVSQWLRRLTSNSGDPGSIPGQGSESHIPKQISKISNAATEI